jgi:hypothetical protein
MVYPALLPLMRTPRLPVVDWTDAPADLHVFVRFAEGRNLVSARVPSHFSWPLPRLNLLNISGRTRLAGNHDLDGQASVRVEPNARLHMPIAGPRLCWLADLRGLWHTSAAVTDGMSIWSDLLDVGLRLCGFMRSLRSKRLLMWRRCLHICELCQRLNHLSDFIMKYHIGVLYGKLSGKRGS